MKGTGFLQEEKHSKNQDGRKHMQGTQKEQSCGGWQERQELNELEATIMTIFIILIQIFWLFVGIWIGMKLR